MRALFREGVRWNADEAARVRPQPVASAIAALSALAVLASGCMTDQGYLTIASTRDVSIAQRDIEKLDFEQLPRMRGIQGRTPP